jgi:hypothetical protein
MCDSDCFPIACQRNILQVVTQSNIAEEVVYNIFPRFFYCRTSTLFSASVQSSSYLIITLCLINVLFKV